MVTVSSAALPDIHKTNQPFKGAGKLQHWLALSVLLLIADQLSKTYANTTLVLYQPVAVFPGLNATLAYNPGAAFSFLSDAGGWQRWFFTILSAVVSVVLIIWLKRLCAATHSPQNNASRLLACALAFILSGAVGNLVDRVIYGYVIDFIQVYYSADSCFIGFSGVRGHCYWPAFNIADAAISVGAALLIVQSFSADNRADNPVDNQANDDTDKKPPTNHPG